MLYSSWLIRKELVKSGVEGLEPQTRWVSSIVRTYRLVTDAVLRVFIVQLLKGKWKGIVDWT
jgi:hypothetical protein